MGATVPLPPVMRTMHNLCMATKTISLKLAAYEKLRSARRYPGESFSDVVMRAGWSEETVTARELLNLCMRRGALLAEETLDRVERLKSRARLPRAKWANH